MLASGPAHDLTYAQYPELATSSEGLLEYHDGAVVAMTAPSPEHARLVAQLVRLVQPGEGRPCATLPAGLKVRVEATNRTLLPDVTVVCGALERSPIDAQAITNPIVVLEVLSPSTEAYDLGAKFHHYRRLASLREYVVLAQDRRFASVSRRAGDLWAFEDLGPGSILQLPSLALQLPSLALQLPSLALQLPSLALQLPLDALYRDALGDIAP